MRKAQRLRWIVLSVLVVLLSSLQTPAESSNGGPIVKVTPEDSTIRFSVKASVSIEGNRRRWTEDNSSDIRTFALQATRRRRELASQMADTAKANEQFAWGFRSEDVYRIDAAIKIAQSLPPISDSGEEWDADPWLLGVANGVIDLHTGELRDETQRDRITKHSPVKYDPYAKWPHFEQFLTEILGSSL